jgi:hypothetical protein
MHFPGLQGRACSQHRAEVADRAAESRASPTCRPTRSSRFCTYAATPTAAAPSADGTAIGVAPTPERGGSAGPHGLTGPGCTRLTSDPTPSDPVATGRSPPYATPGHLTPAGVTGLILSLTSIEQQRLPPVSHPMAVLGSACCRRSWRQFGECGCVEAAPAVWCVRSPA